MAVFGFGKLIKSLLPLQLLQFVLAGNLLFLLTLQKALVLLLLALGFLLFHALLRKFSLLLQLQSLLLLLTTDVLQTFLALPVLLLQLIATL